MLDLDAEYEGCVLKRVRSSHLTGGIRRLLKSLGGVVEVTQCYSGRHSLKHNPYYLIELVTCGGTTILSAKRTKFRDAVKTLHSRLSTVAKGVLKDEYDFED